VVADIRGGTPPNGQEQSAVFYLRLDGRDCRSARARYALCSGSTSRATRPGWLSSGSSVPLWRFMTPETRLRLKPFPGLVRLESSLTKRSITRQRSSWPSLMSLPSQLFWPARRAPLITRISVSFSVRKYLRFTNKSLNSVP
jgi:hypothetical protein